MAEEVPRFYEFGDFFLDAHRRMLRRNGTEVHLTPRAFDLLRVMVENAGRVLDHDELLDKVWHGTFVEQGNLKKAVSVLRVALGESPEAGEYITTVPRRGYRFSADVRPVSSQAVLIRETRAQITIEEREELQAVSGKTKRPIRLRIAIVGVVCLVLAAAAFGTWRILYPNTRRFSFIDAQTTRLMAEVDTVAGAFSPTGDYFCYVLAEGEKQSLWVRQISTQSVIQVVPPVTGSFWAITFAPDGSFVYYTLNDRDDPSRNGVYRVAAFGGISQLVIERIYTGIKVSPDGQRVALIRTRHDNGNIDTHELLTVNTDGSNENLVLPLPLHSLFRGFAWSPDGASILYAVKKQESNKKASYYVAERPSGGGEETMLMPETDKPIVIDEWMPDKRSFIFRMRSLNSEQFQIRQYFPASGETLRVTNDDSNYQQIVVMKNGSEIGGVRVSTLGTIWQRQGEGEFQPIANGAFYSLYWTADNRLIFSITENASDYVGVMDADGKNRRLLTNGNDGIRLHPAVSGDGRQIVFISDRTGSRQIWRMDADGRNQKQVTDSEGIGEGLMLSDGQTVVYSAYLKSLNWLLIKQSSDGRSVQLTDTDTTAWDISPDEKYLAFLAVDPTTQKKRLVVRELESGREVKGFDIDNLESLRFTPDGSALAFIRSGQDFHELRMLPLDGSPERVVTTVSGENISNIDWSPDGSRFAMVRYKVQYEAVLIGSNDP